MPKNSEKRKVLMTSLLVTYIGAHGIANHLIQIIEAAEKLQDTNVLFQLIGGGMTKELINGGS